MQEQEKINLQKQKQLDDLMLKLTEIEQKYMTQLNQEALQNRATFDQQEAPMMQQQVME
jgi:hypothetical protein